jgi:YVTN family beta-propeller protein
MLSPHGTGKVLAPGAESEDTACVPQRKQDTRRFLATVLFTDIVGSTSRAAELGDRAWRDVLERHHAVVRRELKAFGGREMDTAGDGFFAVFETPERAVRCAESVISGVGPLGLEVRAGVHTGECEVVDGKVGGMTVTIGARIAALADAGQVLVSRSVRDLMTGSERRFDGGEAQSLKGVAEQWRVYRLVPEGLDGDAVVSRRASLVPLYTRRQRRRLLVVIAGVTAVALAVSTGYVLTRTHPVVVVGEDAVGVIGPGDVPRVSGAALVGRRPTALAAGFGSVWVTNSADDSVSRVDAKTKSSVPIPVGSSPSGIAVGAGAVWVANSGDGTVSKIDPKTSRVTTIPVRPGPTGIIVAFGSVWVTNALDASVTEIDPDTNEVAPTAIPVGAGPIGIAAGAGYLWVTNQGDGTVTRFDPRTHVVDSPAVKVGSGPVGIAVSGGAAWVVNNLEGSLWRIDVDDLSVTSRTLAKGGGAYGVAAHGGDVWVSNEYAGNLMRVTARTFRLGATVKLRGAPLGLAFVGDDLWFTSAEGSSALHRGGVLTMVGTDIGDGVDPPVFDPTNQPGEDNARLAALTNDGLVGFRRVGGVQGAGLVPDLATALPQPSDGGLTYTFHVRKGVRYSTGAPVLAGDIRRGIERTVVHPDTALSYYYATEIAGAQACEDAANKALGAKKKKPRPDCDLRRGITTDDRTGTVTFHLTKPTPDFPYHLALASGRAVPQDTTVDLRPGTFLPATGPYMVASYTPKQVATRGRPARHGRLELVRNPHFHVWSPAAQPDGYPDRIFLETGYTDKEAVARVTDGRADVLWLDHPPPDVDRLRTRYGSRLSTTAGLWINYVFLNANKPPFNNLDARRAVAYGLDRIVLMSDRPPFAGQTTCQLIPPGFAAYRPYCPFTRSAGDGSWTGPDLAKAQDLVKKSGTRGDKVEVMAFDAPVFRRAASRVVDLLNRLGFDARVRPTNNLIDIAFGPAKRWEAGIINWSADYPAASQYVEVLGSCDAGQFNLSHYCPKDIETQIDSALALQVSDPGRASDAWAAIDRKVVDAAATIPYGNRVRQNFVSSRVGNLLVQAQTGLLLSQLWVQ